MNDKVNGNGAKIKARHLVPVTVAAAIAALVYKVGVPQSPEQLTVFMVLAAFGMLAWMIQTADFRGVQDRQGLQDRQTEIIKTQERIAIILDSHLGVMEKTLTILLEQNGVSARQTAELLPPFVKMMESVKLIEDRLLDTVLGPKKPLPGARETT